MPIYEYQCEACEHQLEALQKISDAPLLECPECGKPALKKKVSAAAFRLKGGGWYETDFKTGNKKNLSGGSDGGGDKSSSTSSTDSKSSDSKSGQTTTSDSKKSDSKTSESKKSA